MTTHASPSMDCSAESFLPRFYPDFTQSLYLHSLWLLTYYTDAQGNNWRATSKGKLLDNGV